MNKYYFSTYDSDTEMSITYEVSASNSDEAFDIIIDTIKDKFPSVEFEGSYFDIIDELANYNFMLIKTDLIKL